MIKTLIHNLLLLSFLFVLSADSISPFFEQSNTVFCELSDISDEEDQEEISSNGFESDLNQVLFIEPQLLDINCVDHTHQFLLSKKYSFTIPTPPPEFFS